MAPVKMYVEKFGREVIIDSEHPWAIAQRALDAAKASASKANAATPDASTRAPSLSSDAAVPAAGHAPLIPPTRTPSATHIRGTVDDDPTNGSSGSSEEKQDEQQQQSGSGDVISVSGGADLVGRRHPTAPQSDAHTADATTRAPKGAAKRSRRKNGDA